MEPMVPADPSPPAVGGHAGLGRVARTAYDDLFSYEETKAKNKMNLQDILEGPYEDLWTEENDRLPAR